MTRPDDHDPAVRLAELGERWSAVQHGADPLNATLLGLTEFDGVLGDPSAEASAATAAAMAGIEREASALDPGPLDAAARIDRAVLIALARSSAADAEDALWAADASAKGYVSRQALVFQAVPAMTATEPDAAERYLTRLGGIAGYLGALGDRYVEEAAAGRVPTRVGVAGAVAQLEAAVASGGGELLRPARAAAPAIAEAAAAIVQDEVRPAMKVLADRLRSALSPLARDDDQVGIDRVPGGERAYASAVARHTTTALTPEQVHAIGLAELEALEARWAEVGGRALGLDRLPDIAQRMRADPALLFRTSAEVVETARAALDRAEAARHGVLPEADIPPCAIEEIGPLEAEHAPLGYYRPPATDGSRAGAYCLLTTAPGDRYRFEYEALTFHESVPGHHLQLAMAQTLDVPRYRRSLDVEACAFNEGWGLYAEALSDELGLYSDDVARLGMLSFHALRACRLVVDTGLHAFGWSRGKAVAFLLEHTVTTRANAVSEVDRYIAWPGQVLAYLIGQREILRLREESRAALGGRFTLLGFHGAVLGSGAVPLDVLADVVTGWRRQVGEEGSWS